MPPSPCKHWLGKLANLHVARTAARGLAPHKPLLLLAVIDMIEAGDVADGWVKYDVRLVSRFRDYWELVRERQRNNPDIAMPFHALGSDRDHVWEAKRLCHFLKWRTRRDLNPKPSDP